MYPVAFEYARADTAAEAVELLAGADGEAKLLAGGHSLIPLLKLRLATPDVLIDVNGAAELGGIEIDAATVDIGAATTWRTLDRDPDVRAAVPLLADTAARIGDPQVRARGTIGGSLAHADPAADVPATLLALDARVESVGPRGPRERPLAEFLAGIYATDLADEEVLTRIRLPRPSAEAVGAYAKFEQPASHLALCGVAVCVELDADGRVRDARVAATGVAPTAFRASAAEQALLGVRPDAAARAEAAALTAEGVEPLADVHADAAYRRHLLGAMTEQALATALARPEGAGPP